MFDIREPGSAPGSTLPVPDAAAPAPGDPSPVPLERLEAQICELAGHLTAATPADGQPAIHTSSSLADALLAVAEAFLAGQAAAADDPEVYQVIVHVGTDALTTPAQAAGVSAETPRDGQPVPGHPADPARCHVEDGPAITPGTIVPPWYGERLNLDEAIYICLANARTPQERQEQRDQADDPELFRPRKWVVEPSDWIRYLNEHTAA